METRGAFAIALLDQHGGRPGGVRAIDIGDHRIADVHRPGDINAELPRRVPEDLGTGLRAAHSQQRSVGGGQAASVIGFGA